ncbi:unnamed protein product [Paramecium primaurelia]|uniref:Uncharacterized protein n=1 Tax=Paramecium primaurelia TaxID=5886 RepID=A0A8S1MI61_PARPR|nr:unnamed protein product [Paramecium primaurelia]
MMTINNNKNLTNNKFNTQNIMVESIKSKENLRKQSSLDQYSSSLPKKILIHKQQFNDLQESLKNRKSKETQQTQNRLPSPINLKILIPPKSKSIQEKKQDTQIQINLKDIIPENSNSFIDWKGIISNLNSPNYPLKKWVRDIIIKNNIIQDYDFAILIRILMQIYKFKQPTLVNIFSEIIEELEK